MSASDSYPSHEIELAASAEDFDALGHVNNAIYLRWVQEVATAHWSALAPEEDQSTTGWVVLRHEIDYLRPAMPGDPLRARTWVGEARGLEFERHTEILGRGGGVIARARTIWCPIDLANGRPRRVSPRVRALFSAAGAVPTDAARSHSPRERV